MSQWSTGQSLSNWTLTPSRPHRVTSEHCQCHKSVHTFKLPSSERVEVHSHTHALSADSYSRSVHKMTVCGWQDAKFQSQKHHLPPPPPSQHTHTRTLQEIPNTRLHTLHSTLSHTLHVSSYWTLLLPYCIWMPRKTCAGEVLRGITYGNTHRHQAQTSILKLQLHTLHLHTQWRKSINEIVKAIVKLLKR